MANIQTYLDLIPPPNSISPKFMAWTAATIQPMVDIQNCALEIQNSFGIETAVGKQLDVLGDILGVSRIVNFQPGGRFGDNKPFPVLIHYDQPGQPLVLNQMTGKKTYLIGWQMVIEDAAQITLRSNATVLTQFNLSDYAGVRMPFHTTITDVACNTETGESLIMVADRALTDFLIYCVEV